MAALSWRIALVCGVAAAAFPAITAAQQQVYRYVDKDGRVIYSDRAPPADEGGPGQALEPQLHREQ